MRISIIIPTFNEAAIIRQAIEAARSLPGETEIIIADGESEDHTRAIAECCGVRVIRAPRGRGDQMNAGACAAQGETLLFLHADTRLPDEALMRIETALRDERVCGGNFSLRFDGESWGAGLLTRLYPLLRLGGMCYGDSGFFVRRTAFETAGGFRNIPLFEDCDLFRRLSRSGRFVRCTEKAVTSSRRFENRFLRTFALWAALQGLYWLGVSPHYLNRFYKPVRERRTKQKQALSRVAPSTQEDSV